MNRPAALLAIALGLLLAACQDTRRDAVRDFLKTHPPENFEVEEIPAEFTVASTADGTNQSVLTVKYRLARPTMRVIDALTQPRGVEISKRIAEIRGWALASLPADNPTRAKISAASAEARVPFPVKQIVTPAGTIVEAVAIVKLTKAASGWNVTAESLDAQVPGQPDDKPDLPMENSPKVAEKFDSLASLAQQLEDARKKYLNDRRLAAERSLATLRSRLRTGNTFEGTLPGSASTRLVITRGIDAGEAVAAVLTVQRGLQSSARYVGGIAQEPSGEYIWRAAQVTSLSGRGGDPATDAARHPILTLAATPAGLNAQIKVGTISPRSLELRESGKVDLIPEPRSQDAGQ